MSRTKVDRPSLIRRALVELVADRGFRGTSMAAVAERAGVAAGTAYVHYASKDELVLATYVEVKHDLGRAGASAVDGGAPPPQRFRALWRAIYDHLAGDPDQARFLIQVEASPYAAEAHAAVLDEPDDPLRSVAGSADMEPLLVNLPDEVVYDLAIGPAVRLAAQGQRVDESILQTLADACWRAVTVE